MSVAGETWTVQTSGTTVDLYDVAWSGSLFVAVGVGGTIRTSPDGVTWSAATSGTTQVLGSIVWTGSQFVCVGAAGTILTSPNGTTWTPQNSGTNIYLGSLSFANGTLFAGPVTIFGPMLMITSTNGVSWSSVTTSYQSEPSGTALSAVVWNGSSYFALASASGFGYTDTIRLSSTDGSTWTHSVYFDSQIGTGELYWSGTEYVAVGGTGHYTSPTGVTWTLRSPGYTLALAKGTDRLVSVGVNGAVKSSTDNINWTTKTSNTTRQLNGIKWSGTKFVAVGNLGTIITS